MGDDGGPPRHTVRRLGSRKLGPTQDSTHYPSLITGSRVVGPRVVGVSPTHLPIFGEETSYLRGAFVYRQDGKGRAVEKTRHSCLQVQKSVSCKVGLYRISDLCPPTPESDKPSELNVFLYSFVKRRPLLRTYCDKLSFHSGVPIAGS